MKPVQSATAQFDHDVVVVGCGPTGATLANLLCQCNVNVLVIDRAPDIYKLPRAVHFDDETMRIFQTVGIADALSNKVRVNPGMRFVDDTGTVLLDWPRPSAIGRHGWHTSYRLHQPDLEELLRVALLKHPSCTVKLGTELLDYQQKDGAVTLRYQDTAHVETCRTKYVVGCDGANSIVRSLMQTGMEDLGFKERWLVVDLLLNSEMPELGDHTLQFCSADQPMTYCRNPGLRRRWEMALPGELDDEQAQDTQRIWSLLERWINPHQAQIERTAVYTFRSALAQRWRDHRVLIAGDAAHLTPPFMGQGMCAGIRDVSNLAWKLARCVFDDDEYTLLDTYQQERRPHAREYIVTAMQLGGLINSIDRHSALSMASSDSRTDTRMVSIAPRLGRSSMVPKLPGVSAGIGTLVDQPRLADGSLLDDVCGYRPMLIARDQNFASESSYSDVAFFSAADHPSLTAVLDSLEVNAILVRPDRYILAMASDVIDIDNLKWVDLQAKH